MFGAASSMFDMNVRILHQSFESDLISNAHTINMCIFVPICDFDARQRLKNMRTTSLENDFIIANCLFFMNKRIIRQT